MFKLEPDDNIQVLHTTEDGNVVPEIISYGEFIDQVYSDVAERLRIRFYMNPKSGW